jgi:arylsulfatase A-like enzyme
MAEQPNILWICTDQQFAGALGASGNKEVDTPHLDRLADRGTRFNEAYCTNPVCVPSRASMLTGRMPHELNVTSNDDELATDYYEETIGRVLNRAGYVCRYGGKWHIPGVDPGDIGFEQICGMDDHQLIDSCIEFIQSDYEDPFFLAAHFDNPHNICEWARYQNLPWGDVERPELEKCPNLPANFHPPPFEPGHIRREMRNRPKTLGAMVDASPDEWRQYRHAYYRLVEKVDRQIGRLLSVLNDEGLMDETVIIFTSDHGDGLGAHQINQKWLLYEEETRVPLIVVDPDTTGGRTDNHLVSTGLDLLPTFCDYANIQKPTDLQGRSLRPLTTGETEEWRDHLIVQTHSPLKGRAVRTERYKYIVYNRGQNREQLFDMVNDRGEMVDLSLDADHDAVLKEHRRLLYEWCIETDDIFAERYPDRAPLIPGKDLTDMRIEE